MKKTVAFVLLCAAFLAASPLARAQDTRQAMPSGALEPARQARVDAVRQQMREDKRGLVERNLQLTPAEAKKFWPVYDDYQAKLDKVNQRQNRAVLDYVNAESNLTDGNAKRIAGEVLAADADEQKLRERYAKQVLKVLPPRKAVRAVQIENKLRAINRFDLAERIPLV
jgi:Spy/CpxP family protein refolding chaperone